jgi:hypothetical protein
VSAPRQEILELARAIERDQAELRAVLDGIWESKQIEPSALLQAKAYLERIEAMLVRVDERLKALTAETST